MTCQLFDGWCDWEFAGGRLEGVCMGGQSTCCHKGPSTAWPAEAKPEVLPARSMASRARDLRAVWAAREARSACSDACSLLQLSASAAYCACTAHTA